MEADAAAKPPVAPVNSINSPFIRRAGGDQVFIGDQSTFRTNFPAQIRPQMPLGVAAGLFQLVAVQSKGALTAITLLTTFQRALSL